jgi:hypothetical protein
VSNLGVGGFEGWIAGVESVEEGLEEVLKRLIARRKMDDAIRESVGLGVMGQVAYERGFSQAVLAVECYRCVGLEGGDGGVDLHVPIQQAREGAGTEGDGAGAGPGLGFLSWHGDVDHAAIDVADLKDIVADGNLTANPALDMHLRGTNCLTALCTEPRFWRILKPTPGA